MVELILDLDLKSFDLARRKLFGRPRGEGAKRGDRSVPSPLRAKTLPMPSPATEFGLWVILASMSALAIALSRASAMRRSVYWNTKPESHVLDRAKSHL